MPISPSFSDKLTSLKAPAIAAAASRDSASGQQFQMMLGPSNVLGELF
jgi:hypothetical protein